MEVELQRWVCSYCGRRLTVNKKCGRPSPGICTKKGKNKVGIPKPHSWVKDK